MIDLSTKILNILYQENYSESFFYIFKLVLFMKSKKIANVIYMMKRIVQDLLNIMFCRNCDRWEKNKVEIEITKV